MDRTAAASGGIDIGPFRTSDADDAIALRLEMLKAHPQSFRSPYETELAKTKGEWAELFARATGENSSSMIVLARSADRLVGMTWCRIDRGQWRIISVYVRKQFRGRGIGRDLMIATLGQIARRGTTAPVLLNVNATNTSAIRLYENIGFRRVALERGRLYGDGKRYDSYSMVRDAEGRAGER